MRTKEEYQEALERIVRFTQTFELDEFEIDMLANDSDILKELIDNLKEKNNENRRIVD